MWVHKFSILVLIIVDHLCITQVDSAMSLLAEMQNMATVLDLYESHATEIISSIKVCRCVFQCVIVIFICRIVTKDGL